MDIDHRSTDDILNHCRQMLDTRSKELRAKHDPDFKLRLDLGYSRDHVIRIALQDLEQKLEWEERQSHPELANRIEDLVQ